MKYYSFNVAIVVTAFSIHTVVYCQNFTEILVDSLFKFRGVANTHDYLVWEDRPQYIDIPDEIARKWVPVEFLKNYYVYYFQGISLVVHESFYELIVVVGVDGGSLQFLVTLNKLGEVIDGLLIHSNYGMGPIEDQENNMVIDGEHIYSEFIYSGDKYKNRMLYLFHTRYLSKSYEDPCWIELSVKEYKIDDNGKINALKGHKEIFNSSTWK